MRQSFLFAFKGFLFCIRTERNFRIHIAVTFYVLIASFVMQLSAIEWIFVLICIGAVTSAEIFNTALEKLCDTLHPERSDGIGMVKDMTAAAVLMFAITSAVIGGIIFFSDEKLTRMIFFLKDHNVLFLLIAVSLPLVVFLVFRRYKNDNKISHDYDSRTSERR